MSLINDMLRDLEKRQRVENRSHAPAVPPAGARSLRPYVLFIIVLLVLCSGAGWYFFSPDNREREPLAPMSDQDQHLPVVPRELTGPASQERSVKDVSSAGVSEPEAGQEKNVALLESLSLSGDGEGASIAIVFSCLAGYELVKAEQGDKSFVFSFAGAGLAPGFRLPLIPAEGLLRQLSLQPQAESLLLLVDLRHKGRLETLTTHPRGAGEILLQLEFRVLELEPVPESVPKPKSGASSRVAAAVSSEPLARPAVPAQQVAEVSKPETAGQELVVNLAQDQQFYQLGLQAFQQGHVDEAAQRFYAALKLNPDLLPARLRLLSILMQQQQMQDAEELAREGLERRPGATGLRKTYVRLLLQQQRAPLALKVLLAQKRPPLTADAEYSALLAATLQENSRFTEAATIYRELVGERPSSALWWFGLGLCSDQSGDGRTAVDAYSKALSLNGLRPDLQAYAKNRLKLTHSVP